jgi:phage tail-like protein
MVSEPEISVEEQPSSYLQFLPGLYREDEFAGWFLRIFEDILKPIESVIDNIAFYIDPETTPQSFLHWLASWVGLVLDERWPEFRRRQLINKAIELYRWRGTKRGVTEFLRIYTGTIPQIIDTVPSATTRHRSDEIQTTKIAKLQAADVKPNCFTIILAIDSSIDLDIVRTIIEIQKPAHTAYILKTNG